MVHQTLSDVPAKQPLNQPLSGIPGARSAIIHRIVRWASGATALYAPTVTCRNEQCMSEVRAQKSEGTGLSGVAPDCPVQLEDKRPQWSTTPNPNGCTDVARTGQRKVTVWCAHR
jgi:hypothetical protein